ncbi:glycosyltransferase [Vibrio rhodolitus]|uniref:glycosyltransferase n=1 Tax=Vibrio rhodolitus TaxID=2231649 RepID=UPI000E0CB425|nr:glycosyltransferase [Vibrio rhodolitus]
MNKCTFEASVIVSFYNNVDALICILRSLETQGDNFEVIVADDGSKQENVDKAFEYIKSSPIPISHVWQKDSGFRKNRILNKALKLSQSEYIIFIDGDCIPQDNFVRDHISNKEKGEILNGRRADIASSFKEKLLSSKHPNSFFKDNFVQIAKAYIQGRGKNVEKGIRVTNPMIFKILNNKKKGIVGCNFSVHKADLLDVNGFDNRYEIPCIGEDTDIEYRLLQKGKVLKNLFHQAIILHPQHPELPRLPQALELFEETKRQGNIVALDGYQQANNVD